MTNFRDRNRRSGGLPGWAGAAASLVLALVSVPASAQQASPTPPPGTPARMAPETNPVDRTVKTVTIPGRRAPARPAVADAQGLKDLRVFSITKGEARISVGSTDARTIHVGDVVEGDVVRAIGDGRIQLSRANPPYSSSSVVVTLESGRVTVHVIASSDRTPPPGIR